MIWIGLGVAEIAAAALLNVWTIARLTPDGDLQPFTVAAIWSFNVGMMTLGVVTIRFRRKEWLRNLYVSLISLVILSPPAGEVFLRAMIAMRNPAFSKPELYAEYQGDDLYWQMAYHWATSVWRPATPERVHPTLGWSQAPVTPENPLGLEEDTRLRLNDRGRKILFYGDSFVKGGSDPEYHIPRYLDDRMADADVLDLGVGGYGTDQIYLLFERTYRLAGAKPDIVMGTLIEDMDRAVLTLRTSQKPYFRLSNDGSLELEGLPIARDQEAYYDERPPRPFSYLIRYFSLNWNPWTSVTPANYGLIRDINGRIIDQVDMACRASGLKLLYVIFYGQRELIDTTWRETLLKQELEARDIPYLDTKPVLLAYAREKGLPLSALYVPDGHHNNLGNQVIAEAILGLYSEDPAP